MADSNPPTNDLKVLAIKEVSEIDGFIVRCRLDGLIRYIHITYAAANQFPMDWDEGNTGNGLLLPLGEYPPDQKCLLLRRPNDSDDLGPDDIDEYPIVEKVNVKLTGVNAPSDIVDSFEYDELVATSNQKVPSERLNLRLSEDRLLRVRKSDDLIKDGTEAPSYLMKLSEFPDEWPRPGQQSLFRKMTSWFSARPEGPKAVDNEPHSYDRDMEHEMLMHSQITEDIDHADGPYTLVPVIEGVVVEKGRGPVGLLTQWIPGAGDNENGAPNFRDILRDLQRNAGSTGGKWRLSDQDRQACRAALRAFHDLGYVHGQPYPNHFLRRPDGTITLVDFSRSDRLNLVIASKLVGEERRKDAEMQTLDRWLALDESSKQWEINMAMNYLS
ncbi:hypothetical protein PG984_011612 [Apiospora sp. TS-2023a]